MHLEVRECFPLRSGHSTLEINIFQIRNTIILYQIHFHFYISCLNRPGIRERKTRLARVLNSRRYKVHGF